MDLLLYNYPDDLINLVQKIRIMKTLSQILLLNINLLYKNMDKTVFYLCFHLFLTDYLIHLYVYMLNVLLLLLLFQMVINNVN